MRQNNPKHNSEARRKNRGRWIGGVYIPRHLILEAQKRRIELLQKESIHQVSERLSFWVRLKIRIQFWLKKLWQKLKLFLTN